MNFKVKILVDVGENYDRVYSLFKFRDFRHKFYRNIDKPHQAEFEFGPLSDEDLDRWQTQLNDMRLVYNIFIKPWNEKEKF